MVDAAAREVLPQHNRRPAAGVVAGDGRSLVARLVSWAAWHARPETRTVAAGMPPHEKPAPVAAAKPAIPRPRRYCARHDNRCHGFVAGAGVGRAARRVGTAGVRDHGRPANAICTAAVADVHCVQGSARLETLQALDRPLLLRLRGQSGDAWALLLELDARDARIALSGKTFDIDRLALQSAWNGEYAGLCGPNRRCPRTSPRSRARGPDADGVAGPETLMALAAMRPVRTLLRVLE